MMQRSSKPKKCRAPGCSNKFIPVRAMQKACCFECEVQLGLIAAEKSKAKREKAERKETREKLEKFKTRREWMKEAQAAFNRFIRVRDAGKPCICCGRPLQGGSVGGDYDCGHYRSVGSAPHLRFVESNAHGQTKFCNRWGAGRAVDYRLGLIERIGLAAVEALEADQEDRKYSIDDLKAIKAHYIAKAKELERDSRSITSP